MRPNESFIGQPIRSLQTMLRVIAEQDSSHVRIIPDGIYGPETVRAVSVFQRNHGLPVTGVTDIATWDAIAAVHELALIEQTEAQSLQIILNPGEVFRRGEQTAYIRIVQAILQTLYEVYSSVAEPSHNGILDDATSDSLSAFQALSGLPMTGYLDKHTWKHLALQYPLAAAIHRRKL